MSLPPGFQFSAREHGQGGPPDWGDPPGLHVAEDVWAFSGAIEGPGGKWTVQYDIEVDPDPYISAFFTIDNSGSNTAQDFTLSAVLPIAPSINVASLTGGSLSGSVIDFDGVGGASLDAIPGEDIYMAMIDGVDYQGLNPSPLPIVAGVGQTAPLGEVSFGTPIPSQPGPPVLNTIGIETNVRLSPNDVAQLVVSFTVTPEPATLSLLLLGGSAVVLRRRQRG